MTETMDTSETPREQRVLTSAEKTALTEATYTLCRTILNDNPNLDFDWISPETSGRVMEQTVGRVLELVAEARGTPPLQHPRAYRMITADMTINRGEINGALRIERDFGIDANAILDGAINPTTGFKIIEALDAEQTSYLHELVRTRNINVKEAQRIQDERPDQVKYRRIIIIDDTVMTITTAYEIRKAFGKEPTDKEMPVYAYIAKSSASLPWIKATTSSDSILKFLWSSRIRPLRGVKKGRNGDESIIEPIELDGEKLKQKEQLERELEAIAKEAARLLTPAY